MLSAIISLIRCSNFYGNIDEYLDHDQNIETFSVSDFQELLDYTESDITENVILPIADSNDDLSRADTPTYVEMTTCVCITFNDTYDAFDNEKQQRKKQKVELSDNHLSQKQTKPSATSNVSYYNKPSLECSTFIDFLPINAYMFLNDDIRHINERCHEKHVRICCNAIQRIYTDILSNFWNVFYGFYDDKMERVKLYIQYDDDKFFMKINIFKAKDELVYDIVNFTKNVYKKYKYYVAKPAFINRSNCRARSCLVEPSCDNWIDNLLFFLNKCTSTKNKENEYFFSVLKNELNQSINTGAVNSPDTFIYLTKNANMFFEMLSMDYRFFVSICYIDINSIYKKQLYTFFSANFYFKLLIFPELMSLYKHYDKIERVNFCHSGRHKAYIGYYVLCKFEIFIRYLKNLLNNNVSEGDRLHQPDILFIKVYITELYFIYLYNSCFNINYHYIVAYVCLNRILLFESSDNTTSISTCKLIEFVLFNFLDFSSVLSTTQFYNILIQNIRYLDHTDMNVLIKSTLSYVLDNNKCLNRIADKFTGSLNILINIDVDGLIQNIIDDARSILLSNAEKNNAIIKWMTDIKYCLMQNVNSD